MSDPQPVLKDCPGVGSRGNLDDGWHGNCTFCNARLPMVDGKVTPHQTFDVLAMLRGDTGAQ